MFSDEPQPILPKRSAIKLFRYKTKAEEGEREYLVGDPVTIEGPAYDLIYEAVRRTKEIIEGIEKLGPSGMEKVTYPHETLHEIITNAVLHRDYSIAADVQVRIFDNRVEIESPGRLPGHITKENVLREQFARNPRLVRLINRFPDPPNKDVGEGLNTAFEAMEKLRLKPPLLEDRENSFVVVIRHESLGSPEQLVIEYLKTHDEITNAIGRELSGIKSENSMKEVFYRLRDKGLLNSIRLRRIAEGRFARVPRLRPVSDVTTHPPLVGGASRPERARHDATPPAHARRHAASWVFTAHPGSLHPRGPPTGCAFSPSPRPTGGGAPARVLPVPRQRQALRSGQLHHRPVRHQVLLRAHAQPGVEGLRPRAAGAGEEAAGDPEPGRGAPHPGVRAPAGVPGLPDDHLRLRSAPAGGHPTPGGRRGQRARGAACPRQGPPRPVCAA